MPPMGTPMSVRRSSSQHGVESIADDIHREYAYGETMAPPEPKRQADGGQAAGQADCKH
jgi:hypothetical protein